MYHSTLPSLSEGHVTGSSCCIFKVQDAIGENSAGSMASHSNENIN